MQPSQAGPTSRRNHLHWVKPRCGTDAMIDRPGEPEGPKAEARMPIRHLGVAGGGGGVLVAWK
jgi:hypothetical protein